MIPNHVFLKINIVIYFHRGITQQVDVLDEKKNAEKIFNIDLIK